MEERLADAPLSGDEIVKQWLLNSAIHFPVSLTLLFPLFRWGRLNLKDIPNAQGEDYARNLLELFDLDMIHLSSLLPGDEPTTRPGFARILDRFLALPKDFQHVHDLAFAKNAPQPRPAPDPKTQVDFRLTARGGESWEKLARPEWNRFISGFSEPVEGGDGEEMTGDLISPDRNLLIAYMGWYREVNGEEIHLETIEWETHADHEVLYWKRLPFVYHAHFRVAYSKSRWKHYIAPNWFDDWWQRSGHWHKHPWELPGWPE
jgi:hypothetical protein